MARGRKIVDYVAFGTLKHAHWAKIRVSPSQSPKDGKFTSESISTQKIDFWVKKYFEFLSSSLKTVVLVFGLVLRIGKSKDLNKNVKTITQVFGFRFRLGLWCYCKDPTELFSWNVKFLTKNIQLKNFSRQSVEVFKFYELLLQSDFSERAAIFAYFKDEL